LYYRVYIILYYKKKNQISKKANKDINKPSSGNVSYIKPVFKIIVINKPIILKPEFSNLKYYNYNKFSYIFRNYSESKIEYIKQILIAKLVVFTINKLFKDIK
jgi:hypothetical protein